MNQLDKKRLGRLHQILGAVPFAAVCGVKSQSIAGLTAYEQDMRALLPAVRDAIMGMVVSDYEDWEEGIDYQDPDLVLDALEAWIEMRKGEQWEGATGYDGFQCFYEEFREGKRG